MKRLLALLVILIFAALGAGGYLAYEAYLLVFPALPPALYAGLLEPEDGEPIPLFVDSSRGPRDLWVAVGDDAMPAQRVKTADSSGSAGLPLIATGSGTRLRLTGDERRQGEDDHRQQLPETFDAGLLGADPAAVPVEEARDLEVDLRPRHEDDAGGDEQCGVDQRPAPEAASVHSPGSLPAGRRGG